VSRFTSPGLLNLNKPAGMTSREVVDIVGRVARTRRAGHAGTLDPLATGVLIVCLNWATRLVPFVQQLPKFYRAEFRLGQTSDTEDVTGNIQDYPDAIVPNRRAVEKALLLFIGTVQQVPPAYSAVHVGGRRAYELARQGEVVDLAPRDVEIHRIAIVEFDYPRLVLDIECGSGTYVRSIGRDLGIVLGCGALMTALERRGIGSFSVESAVSPETLNRDTIAGCVLPPASAVQQLPHYVCHADQLVALKQGRPLVASAELFSSSASMIAVVDEAGALLALAEPTCDRQSLQPRHVFCIEPG